MIVAAKARIRRIAVTLLVVIAIFLGLVILIIPPPDLSAENVILRKIAKLTTEVDQVKYMNIQRQGELQRLFQQFSSIQIRLKYLDLGTTCSTSLGGKLCTIVLPL